MTRNWKQIARASGLGIRAADLAGIARTLDALEAAFRPLVQSLPPEAEPAVIFYAAPSAPPVKAELLTPREDAE